MDFALITGIIGSIILVAGAAWPEAKKPSGKGKSAALKTIPPVKSIKNWLFAIGGLVMLGYAILNFLQGGAFFFVILQIFIVLTSIFMMLDTPDKIDVPITALAGAGLVVWSFFLFEGWSTVVFILGLCGVGIGYVMQTGTQRRNIALTVGSAFIAIFSYFEANWIFFWINIFFAIFSAYYIYKAFVDKVSSNPPR